MLPRILLHAQRVGAVLNQQLHRNYGVTAVMYAQLDPIQKLFVEKIKEYAKKSKAGGGSLVDASPDVMKSLTDEIEKLDRQYGAKGADMTHFPEFTFKDKPLDPVGVNIEAQETVKKVETTEDAAVEEEEKPHWEY